jgi:hypothetical protein
VKTLNSIYPFVWISFWVHVHLSTALCLTDVTGDSHNFHGLRRWKLELKIAYTLSLSITKASMSNMYYSWDFSVEI